MNMLSTSNARTVAIGVAALLTLPMAAIAHGDDEVMDMGKGIGEGVLAADPTPDPNSYPPSYFTHPDYRGTIYLHIILMSLAWVFMLPTAVMMSLARSRYTLAAQFFFLATNTIGVVVGTIYNASTPDLYPNNLHHKLGWVMTVVTAVHVLVSLTARLVGVFKRRSSSRQEKYEPVPISRDAMQEHERLHKHNHHRQSPYRLSNDSGQGTERLSDSLRRSHSISTTVFDENQQIPLHDIGKDKDEDEDEDLELGELTSVPAPKSSLTGMLASAGGKISTKAWRAIALVYNIFDRVLPVLGFVVLCTGFATFGRFFEGHGIFNGLAHWIKGGIFFWFGIFTLGRWAGSFGELGWAWNLSPGPAGSKRRITAEFVESALIFTYGATNIFLEHLGNWGKEWTSEDLEHISITVLFIGGGLCGMLVESTRIRELLNTNVAAELCRHHVYNSSNGNDEECSHHRAQQQKPTEYSFSLNPLPALVILLVGIMMSSHTQTTAMGSMVHKQWGNLLAGASFARGFTYILLYLRPPRTVFPSRPPTELLAAFALMAGGLIFMASASDSVDGMILNQVNEMFVYTCVMGIVGVVMAWVILLVALKGWATRREMRGRKGF